MLLPLLVSLWGRVKGAVSPPLPITVLADNSRQLYSISENGRQLYSITENPRNLYTVTEG